MGRVAAASLAVFCVSCDGDSAEPVLSNSSPAIRVAVADVENVDSLVPSGNPAGSPAHIFELVFEWASEHLEMVGREEATILLRRLEGSPYSAEELASSLQFRGLRQTSIVRDGIVAEFDSVASAAHFSVERAGVAVGPYQVLETEGRVRLEPRDGRGGRSPLELVSAARDDHWRLLIGHHLEVAPRIRASDAPFVSGVPSIQLTGYPLRARLALLLNPQSATLALASTRSTISSAIDASALAKVICGEAECDIGSEGSSPPESVRLPRLLELLALDGSKDEALAAKVVAHQLWEAHGTRVVVKHLPVEEMSRRLLSKDYQLLFMPIAADPKQMFKTLSGAIDHQSHRLEAAVARGAWDDALQELVDDAVLIPLWNQRSYAAVDSSICGAKPDSAISWLWLADLYPCDEGAL